MTDLNQNTAPNMVPDTTTPAAPVTAAPSAPPPDALDGLTPVDGTLKPLAAPQQSLDGLTPVDGTFKPLPVSAPTSGSTLGDVIAGPNTVLGTVASENAGEAVGTPYEAEAKLGAALVHGVLNRARGLRDSIPGYIMSGSPAERVIQTINPDFKGTAPAYNPGNILKAVPFASKINSAPASQPDVFNQPLVDVAQNIDKQKHPMLKAVTEAAQGMTSPENLAILATTKNFGVLTNSPAALSVTSRLMSAGFTAQAVGAAADHSDGFVKAVENGDYTEAMYQLTHLTLSGATAIIAGSHAAGEPLTSAREGTWQEPAANAAKEAAGKVAEVAKNAAGKVNEAASNAAKSITELRPEQLTKRPEAPAPQHGAPVRVESPLDSATVGTKLGGKDLSQEALDTLQEHVGDKVPVGGTAKGQLMKAVEPVTKTINETASKMNDVVQQAPKFTTSVMQDSVFGEGGLTSTIDALKKDLPPSVRESLGGDVDAVMEDADKALNSNDPVEVLEYRRQLGKKIDWDAIEKNPSTPAEAQNLARVKVYQAIGNKIHAEIPETIELDKTLQPNLELRSHMTRKLGERVVDDPHAATVEAQSELKKGKDSLDVAAHNEAVAKNWQRIKYGLIALGVGSGVIHEIEKFL